MAKTAIDDYSTTASSNTDIDGVDSTGSTGLVKSGDNYARSIMAHAKAKMNDLGGVNTVGGTADAITVTLSSAPSALVDGMRFTFNASAANTGATLITVTPAGGSAFAQKKVMKWSAGSEAELVAGDIPAANALVELVYDSARNSAAGAFMLLGTSVASATTSQAGIVELATLAETLAGTDTSRAVVPANLYFPTGHLWGNTLANDTTDATNDLVIGIGTCRDSTDTQNILASSSLIKKLDANWAAGTNQGMRYSGAAIANGTYHLYRVAKALGADPDVYADPSATEATVLGHLQAETGGADYLYVRRIGSIIRSGGTILAFKQFGDEFILNAAVLDVDADNPGTSAVTRTLTVPSGVRVRAVLNVGMRTQASTNIAVNISSLEASDQAPSSSAAPLSVVPVRGAVDVTSFGRIEVLTNTSSQVRSRISSSAAGDRLAIATLGWFDTRGRLF